MSRRVPAMVLPVVILLVVGCAGTAPVGEAPTVTALASRPAAPPSTPAASPTPPTAEPVVAWDSAVTPLSERPTISRSSATSSLPAAGSCWTGERHTLRLGGPDPWTPRRASPWPPGCDRMYSSRSQPPSARAGRRVPRLAGRERRRLGLRNEMKDRDSSERYHTVRAETGGGPTIDATWTHLAGVFDAAAGEITLYVDGRSVASTASASRGKQVDR